MHFCTGAIREHSPALQRWAAINKTRRVPQGRQNLLKLVGVKFQPMPPQKKLHLRSKRSGAMMLLLRADVGDGLVNTRDANRERPISFLPRDVAKRRKRFMQPLRRITLEQLHRLGNRERRRQAHQRVDMIRTPPTAGPSSHFRVQCRPGMARADREFPARARTRAGGCSRRYEDGTRQRSACILSSLRDSALSSSNYPSAEALGYCPRVHDTLQASRCPP